ncbi:ribonucleoside-diphosphate reductase subunit alpha [Treponema putidum]|uniref:Ribonucleoside-diphosphate reductase n=1 Tax=Treponema putidum TaxID=221027 RepID=A0AAE9SK45_9SPIR|nr:ribonucleoside-diphosphate reductase subunit alpha [Treponema putidum]UTY34501.1 ribonucleoside-diphosphate reductase subunit alpha [Treponema putidum]
MQIIKRNGETKNYEPEKIEGAIRSAFKSVENSPHKDLDKIIPPLVKEVEEDILELSQNGNFVHVETIQDLVEKTLIEHNYYAEVKNFILYRVGRTKRRDSRQMISRFFDTIEIQPVLTEIQNDFTSDEYSLTLLAHKFLSFRKENMSESESLAILIKASVELTAQDAPDWEFIAARLLMLQFNLKLKTELEKRQIHSFYEKIKYLENEGLYGTYICKAYNRDDLEEAASFIKEERNKLFTYSALDLLLRRYAIRTHSNTVLESPQEIFLGIALHLAMKEKSNRLEWVRRFYDMMSTLKVTMATPTLSNARKPYHQLSSCFIDTVPDSLDGIYRSIDNFAKVSKFGGGMGLYFGKVRAVGSPIRGFMGAAGGIIRWIKLANDTAVAVDQLGVRQGSVAVYLDVWHKDIPEFLQLRTNNGDDRMKAHDVFPAVCYPDLFWKTVRDDINASWHLMCPHEISKTKGYALEDFYGEEWEKRYKDCVADSRINKREIPIKDLVRLILKSSVETGTPFAFNRDHANKTNPNPHKGMIYCSNLCTEISQNMSEIKHKNIEIKTEDGDTVVITTTIPGDFVVCNLASIVLGNINVNDEKEIDETVSSAVRALDNVIDLNFYPVPYAQITNSRYRSIGLGASGYHHALAKNGIAWESEEHLNFADKVFERINYAAIKASSQIAKEKGSYAYFEGSDWQTGEYFKKRNYVDEKWKALAEEVKSNGMRNAYLLAVAPTSSTSIIAGTTAGVDPIMNKYFLEEKKGSLMPRVAPSLSPETYWLYKNAHHIEQDWSIRAAGLRQRHIDQAQSVNLYITNEFTFSKVLSLYVKAWEEGLKSIYYVRSRSLEVEECESCSS